jgi:hypothetical protein
MTDNQPRAITEHEVRAGCELFELLALHSRFTVIRWMMRDRKPTKDEMHDLAHLLGLYHQEIRELTNEPPKDKPLEGSLGHLRERVTEEIAKFENGTHLRLH